MIDKAQIQDLDAQQLRQVVRTLIADVAGKDAQIAFKQAFIDKLTHEMAVLKRLKFAAQSEAYNAEQKSLLEETIDTAACPECREVGNRIDHRWKRLAEHQLVVDEVEVAPSTVTGSADQSPTTASAVLPGLQTDRVQR